MKTLWMSPADPPGTMLLTAVVSDSLPRTASDTTAPSDPAKTPRARPPTAQPTTVGQCNRHASPKDERRLHRARCRPARSARRPAPISRRTRIDSAHATRAAAKPRFSRSGASEFSVKAWVCWPQPIGVSQDGQAGVRYRPLALGSPSASPIALSMKPSGDGCPRDRVRRPGGLRELRGERRDAGEAESGGAGGRPGDDGAGRIDTCHDEANGDHGRHQEVRQHARRAADRSVAPLGTGVAPISSARPSSSSARVCRTMRKVLMSPAMTARKVKSSKNSTLPIPVPCGAPRIASRAGFCVASITRAVRSSSPPNSAAAAEALP